MSAPRRNGEEGSGGRRLYKLVGALVVALVIVAALVPLWLGGGDGQQTRLVEVQPETLNGPSEGDAASEGPQDPDKSGQEVASKEDGGKWWQPEGSGDASEEPEGAEESAPVSPAEEPAGPEAPAGTAEQEEPAPAQETEDEPTAKAEEASPPPDDTPEVDVEERKTEPEAPYWTVMAGSFQDPENARGLRDNLRDQDFTAQVVSKTIEGRKWHRVYAGREGSRGKAEEVLTRLREAGYDDLLVLQAE